MMRKKVYSDILPHFGVTSCLAHRDILPWQGALPHGKSCVVRFNLLFSSDSALVCPLRLQGHSSALEQEKHMAFVREKEEDVS